VALRTLSSQFRLLGSKETATLLALITPVHPYSQIEAQRLTPIMVNIDVEVHTDPSLHKFGNISTSTTQRWEGYIDVLCQEGKTLPHNLRHPSESVATKRPGRLCRVLAHNTISHRVENPTKVVGFIDPLARTTRVGIEM